MTCMRCGRETTENHVFCDNCQQNMAQYPVKPGTAIHLPHRPVVAPTKKQAHRRRPLSPEEQVIHLRKMLKRMWVFLALLTLVLCMATAMLVHEILHPEDLMIGRNYTIETTSQAD